MRGKGLGDWLQEVSTVRRMDVVLPARDAGEPRLRVVARPDRPVAERLVRLGIELPSVPKRTVNVVEKIAG